MLIILANTSFIIIFLYEHISKIIFFFLYESLPTYMIMKF